MVAELLEVWGSNSTHLWQLGEPANKVGAASTYLKNDAMLVTCDRMNYALNDVMLVSYDGIMHSRTQKRAEFEERTGSSGSGSRQDYAATRLRNDAMLDRCG